MENKHMIKEVSMIGKLITKSNPAFSEQHLLVLDKNVSANLSFINPEEIISSQQHSQPNRSFQYHLTPTAHLQRDPLSQDQPLKRLTNNANKLYELRKIAEKQIEEEVYFLDCSRGKISRCFATQRNSPIQNVSSKITNSCSSVGKSKIRVKPSRVGSIKHQRKQPIHHHKKSISARMNNHQREEVTEVNRINKNMIRFRSFLDQYKNKDQYHYPHGRVHKIQSYDFKLRQSEESVNFGKAFNQSNQYNNDQQGEPTLIKKRFIKIKQQTIIKQLKESKKQLSNAKTSSILLRNNGNFFIQDEKMGNHSLAQYLNDVDDVQSIESEKQHEESKDKQAFRFFEVNASEIFDSEHCISINMLTPILLLKQLLIEKSTYLKLSFVIPEKLFTLINRDVSQEVLHGLTQSIFECARIQPQLVSLKKFTNCTIISVSRGVNRYGNNKMSILWHYSGRFYFGGWKSSNFASKEEGFKHGIGMEYFPGKYIYYGEFKENSRDGYGVMKKSNQQIYLGEWKRGQKNGQGKLFSQTGNLLQKGHFQNNQIQTYSSFNTQKVA